MLFLYGLIKFSFHFAVVISLPCFLFFVVFFLLADGRSAAMAAAGSAAPWPRLIGQCGHGAASRDPSDLGARRSRGRVVGLLRLGVPGWWTLPLQG